jgi:hypothetical protein
MEPERQPKQPPTRDQFEAAFRARMLGFMSEAWAVRGRPPSDFGQMMDHHLHAMRQLMTDMYAYLRPDQVTQPPAQPPIPGLPLPAQQRPAVNGQPPQPVAQRRA